MNIHCRRQAIAVVSVDQRKDGTHSGFGHLVEGTGEYPKWQTRNPNKASQFLLFQAVQGGKRLVHDLVVISELDVVRCQARGTKAFTRQKLLIPRWIIVSS